MIEPESKEIEKENWEKAASELNEKFSNFYSFKIFTHKNPDGDALGSALALKKILELHDKKAEIFIFDSIDEHFSFFPGIESVKLKTKLEETVDNASLFVFLDCSSPDRAGFDALAFAGKEIVIIDHHLSGSWEHEKALKIINSEASSTAEIIFRVFEKMKWKMDHDIFFCLLAGILSDTGTLQHSNTSSGVLQIISRLIRTGINFKKISDNLFKKKKVEGSLKIWGKILARAAVDGKTKMAYSFVSQNDLKEFGASEDELSGLVNLLSGIPEGRFSLLLVENKFGKTKGSLRSEAYKNVNVAKIAEAFGGGGHKLAAGFELGGKVEDNIELIKRTIAEELLKQ